MDKLTGMAMLVRVVQAGSFTAVAHELGTTQSNVSKTIAKLEANLGVQLLHRTNRHLSLTPVGERYFEDAQKIVAAVEGMESDARNINSKPVGLIRIACPQVFGQTHVVPIVLSFVKEFPEIRIELDMSDQYVDISEGRYDLAIRVGNLEDSNLKVVRLGKDPRFVVATREYIRRYGEPQQPADLAHHRCITYSYLSTGNQWRFSGPDGESTIRVNGPMRLNNGEAIRQAVLASLGVGLLGNYLIHADLREGRLKPLLKNHQPISFDIQAVYNPGVNPPARLRAFIDFLREQLRRRLPLEGDAQERA